MGWYSSIFNITRNNESINGVKYGYHQNLIEDVLNIIQNQNWDINDNIIEYGEDGLIIFCMFGQMIYNLNNTKDIVIVNLKTKKYEISEDSIKTLDAYFEYLKELIIDNTNNTIY